jgi:Fur family ferric uptake transcriptional regulator
MICTECGKTIEFYSAELEAIQDAIVANHKFRPTQHSLRIFGVCAQCQRHTGVNAEESTAEPRIRFASAPNTQ